MTLVELLVALFIVMLAFAALASTIIASFSSIRQNEARVRAVALATEAVEEMASMPWNQLGLSENDTDLLDELAAVDADEEEEALTFEEELVVLSTAAPKDVVAHVDDVEFGGIQYTITRWVTFSEEADQDDLKRMVAIVSWESFGREGEVRHDGLRAPNPEDLGDLSVDLVAETAHESGYGTLLHDSNFRPRDSITLTATGGTVPVGDVRFTFRDRVGDLRTIVGSATNVNGGFETEVTLTAGTDGPYGFKHGGTPFSVFIEGEEGETASDTAIIRFYQYVEIDPDGSDGSLDVRQDGESVEGEGTQANPFKICTDDHLSPEGEVTMEVDVWGMTGSEATPTLPEGEDEDADLEGGLTVTFFNTNTDDSAAALDEPILMGLVERTAAGGRFEATLEGTLFDEATLVTEVRINADRVTGYEDFNDDDEGSFYITAEGSC